MTTRILSRIRGWYLRADSWWGGFLAIVDCFYGLLVKPYPAQLTISD